MDSIVFGGIALFVLIGPWVLLWRVNVRRKRERGEDQGQWRESASRISALERTLETLQAQLSRRAPEEATPKTSDRPVALSYTPPSSAPRTPPPPPGPTVVQPTPPVRVAESGVTQKAAESATTRYSSTTDRVIPPAPTPVTPLSQPGFTATEPGPSLADRLKSSLDVEEILGTNWLNKLGIVILVLGVAFFLAYQLKTLGPAGQVLGGFATGGVMP